MNLINEKVLNAAAADVRRFEQLLSMPVLFTDREILKRFDVLKKVYDIHNRIIKDDITIYLIENNINMVSDNVYKPFVSITDDTWNKYLDDLVIDYKIQKAKSIMLSLNNPECDCRKLLDAIESEVVTDIAYNKSIFHIKEVMKEMLEQGDPERMDIGISFFNNKDGGMSVTEVMYMFARPGTGKTSTTINIIKYCILNNQPLLFFSSEMDRKIIMRKMACSLSGINENAVKKKMLTKEMEFKYAQAIERLAAGPMYICDIPNINIKDIERYTKYMVRKHNIQFVIIDHLHILTHDNINLNEYQLLGILTSKIKQLARDKELFILCLGQMNRNIESRGTDALPTMADIRGSGKIDENADIITFIRRYSEEDKNNIEILQYIVDKNRNGIRGFYKSMFNKDICRITEF